MDSRLDLVLKADLSELDGAIGATEQFCHEHGATNRVSFLFALALDELLTNVVSYGYPEGSEHEVRMSLWTEADRIFGEFIDDGIAFDPLRQAPAADVDAGVGERRLGGQGIHLIRTLMDGVEYDRENGRNHLRFWKQLETE